MRRFGTESDGSQVEAKGFPFPGCDFTCKSGCSIRCDVCPLDVERIIEEERTGNKIRCCRQCPPLRDIDGRRSTASGMDPESVNWRFFDDHSELTHVDRIIYLGGWATCSERALEAFDGLHANRGYDFRNGIPVYSFEEGVAELRKRNRRRTALLVPDLHPVEEALAKDPRYRKLRSQSFKLPNPPLFVARPENPLGEHNILFMVAALRGLVEKAYGGRIPFEEIVETSSTAIAAEQCGQIFRGGHCVVNEGQVSLFHLVPEKKLPEKVVKWSLWKYRGHR